MAAFLTMNGLSDEVGLPLKTLQNRLDTRSGLIRLDNAPALRTLLLGRRRMVARSDLDNWLRQLGALPSKPPAQPTATPESAAPAPRRPGRPRKSTLLGSGQ